ncbi:transglutaminase family protein [Halomicronema hongdechloris]|uniref:transglutaminase family protein n=1 Tax=Halomicronema hongdechloris TaxID=1209493 RepID=UPI0010CC0736|nr:transglutaminase family protein [Halomicronema hongdechloris]
MTISGVTPDASLLLRRPDLLSSNITDWQNHPSLAYGFGSQFIDPSPLGQTP